MLVDDDVLALRAYCGGLSRQGFQVDVATDGLAALNLLRFTKFDVLVLDLLMPRVSGFEVLKFIRLESDMADLPVIVLSNWYLREEEREITASAQRELLKAECTPTILGRTIKEVLRAHELAHSKAALGRANDLDGCAPDELAPSSAGSKGQEPNKVLSALTRVPDANGPTCGNDREGRHWANRPQVAASRSSGGVRDWTASAEAIQAADLRKNFISQAGAHSVALRVLFERYKRAGTFIDRELNLTNLFRKVRFVTLLAASAGFEALARMGTPFEALLFHYLDRPERVNAAVLRTVAAGIDFLNLLLEAAASSVPLPNPSGEVLVVDDDNFCSHIIVSALERARLPAQSTASPLTAWEWAQKKQFDLLLLDVEMPGMDGFELCHRIRRLPGYRSVPAIFVTVHNDFETRACALLTGADDFITKPVVPMEVAVKGLMYMLKSRLPPSVAASAVASTSEAMRRIGENRKVCSI